MDRWVELLFEVPRYGTGIVLMEADMTKSEALRQNAENCTELAEIADSQSNKMRYQRMAKSWTDLADTQAWLDGEVATKTSSRTE